MWSFLGDQADRRIVTKATKVTIQQDKNKLRLTVEERIPPSKGGRDSSAMQRAIRRSITPRYHEPDRATSPKPQRPAVSPPPQRVRGYAPSREQLLNLQRPFTPPQTVEQMHNFKGNAAADESAKPVQPQPHRLFHVAPHLAVTVPRAASPAAQRPNVSLPRSAREAPRGGQLALLHGTLRGHPSSLPDSRGSSPLGSPRSSYEESYAHSSPYGSPYPHPAYRPASSRLPHRPPYSVVPRAFTPVIQARPDASPQQSIPYDPSQHGPRPPQDSSDSPPLTQSPSYNIKVKASPDLTPPASPSRQSPPPPAFSPRPGADQIQAQQRSPASSVQRQSSPQPSPASPGAAGSGSRTQSPPSGEHSAGSLDPKEEEEEEEGLGDEERESLSPLRPQSRGPPTPDHPRALSEGPRPDPGAWGMARKSLASKSFEGPPGPGRAAGPYGGAECAAGGGEKGAALRRVTRQSFMVAKQAFQPDKLKPEFVRMQRRVDQDLQLWRNKGFLKEADYKQLVKEIPARISADKDLKDSPSLLHDIIVKIEVLRKQEAKDGSKVAKQNTSRSSTPRKSPTPRKGDGEGRGWRR